MLLKRFYDDKLAQASYLIGCQATGEAIVVDPNRDVAFYVDAVAREGMTLRYVSETHIHADYLSGARELAHRTGATLLLSGDGPEEWQYGFVEQSGARLLHDGDVVELGKIRIQVIHTPGHTPEHISFMVTDGAASDRPMGVLTGDFVFVGDVGRPDLLEKAAGVSGTMEEGARTLYRSLERFRAQPDYLQILPGHGAGSACGKALGAVPTSTLGYEKLVNWAFQCATEEEFVEQVLEDQPEPPAYFAVMKRLNRDGPPLLGPLPEPPRLDATGLPALMEGGPTVVDLRDAARFRAGHVPGTLSIPLNSGFPNWAGWLLPYDRPVYFVADHADQAREAARDLALIGIDSSAGWFGPEALDGWADACGTVETTSEIPWDRAEEMAGQEKGVFVDVRRQTEWDEGHVAGARHVHLGYLGDRADELPRDRPLLVYCRTGARSGMAASLLQARGFTDVHNVAGGIVERGRRGLPVSRES
ncbi:MAG: rhodanese-like domain-containing protein [Longimicrobiales bacterium]